MSLGLQIYFKCVMSKFPMNVFVELVWKKMKFMNVFQWVEIKKLLYNHVMQYGFEMKKRNRILAKIKKNKTAIFGIWSPLIFFGCTNQGWLKGILGIFSCRLFGDHYHLTNNECQTWDICNHFDTFWTKYTAKMTKKMYSRI